MVKENPQGKQPDGNSEDCQPGGYSKRPLVVQQENRIGRSVLAGPQNFFNIGVLKTSGKNTGNFLQYRPVCIVRPCCEIHG